MVGDINYGVRYDALSMRVVLKHGGKSICPRCSCESGKDLGSGSYNVARIKKEYLVARGGRLKGERASLEKPR